MSSHSKSTLSSVISAAAACICRFRVESGRVPHCSSSSDSRFQTTLTPRLPGSSSTGRCCTLNRSLAVYSTPRSDSRATASSMPLLNRSATAPRTGPIMIFQVIQRALGGRDRPDRGDSIVLGVTQLPACGGTGAAGPRNPPVLAVFWRLCRQKTAKTKGWWRAKPSTPPTA